MSNQKSRFRSLSVARALVLVPLLLGVVQGQTGAAVREPARSRVARLAQSAAVPRFGEPTISGVQGNGFESDLRIDPKGRIYSSVPDSLSSATSWIWRSLDQGRTFKWVPASTPLQGKLPTCPGGGDSELATDSKGHLYFSDLTLVNLSAGRSDDHGATFKFNCASVETTPDDRMWYATDGDPTNGGNIYVGYNIFEGGLPICDGGTQTNNELAMARSPLPGAGADAGINFAPSLRVTAPCAEGILGNLEVSPVTHHIFTVHDNRALDGILMVRCKAVDFTVDPSGLSCVDLPVATFPGFVTGGNFPTMAVDSGGNLYAVWEEAPGTRGNVTGDTLLYFSSSTDEGDHWTAPVQIPTPGLHTNVFAWGAAGDPGRVDVAWYGTNSQQDPGTNLGPDSTTGDWSLYLTQTLDGLDPAPAFTPPLLAGEHFIHHGTMFTLIGGQNGDRSLGDFFQLRIGLRGEANISYADSNNIDEGFAPHNMFVQQNGGPSVLAAHPVVNGLPAPRNFADDPAGDATLDSNGSVGPTQDNLDILSSSVSTPDPAHLRITMKVRDLTSLAPGAQAGGNDLVWLAQWLVPSSTDPNGGKNFFAYMESTNGGAPKFYDGENAATLDGGGVALTYPGAKTATGYYTPTAPGTITIDVPKADVNEAGAIDGNLYSVTASAMSLEGPANSVPSSGGIGGSFFNLLDSAPAYDYVPARMMVDGDARTAYPKQRQVRVDVDRVFDDQADATPPSGFLDMYVDTRADPPGPAMGPFTCTNGFPTALTELTSNTVRIDGTLSCRHLARAVAYSLTVTDNGTNPPNQDSYRMILYDSMGNPVYDWSDVTTVGLGELRVRVKPHS